MLGVLVGSWEGGAPFSELIERLLLLNLGRWCMEEVESKKGVDSKSLRLT
jgi:hypothetical protein